MVLIVGKKEFTHAEHQKKFKETWLRKFDRELDPLQEVLYEFPIAFPPSYPFEEQPDLPHDYMNSRCPAWCDRILMSPTAKTLIDDDRTQSIEYKMVGNDVCMGDHKVRDTAELFVACSNETNFARFHFLNQSSQSTCPSA